MKPNEIVHIRQQENSFYPDNTGYYGDPGSQPYPGLENPYAGGRSNLPVPYNQPPAAWGAGANTGAGSGLLGSFNLNQVKGFVDKMGGIDGIVNTMTRVQKMVSSFQQMAPMLKLLMGSFGGGAKAASNSMSSGGYSETRPRRKKRTKTSKKSRSGVKGKRKSTTGRKRR